MRLIRETAALSEMTLRLGISGCFTFWEDYRREYIAFSGGETVLRAGEMPAGFFFLLSGRMRIYSLSESGALRQIALADSEREVPARGGSRYGTAVLGDVEFMRREPAPNHVESVGDTVFLRVAYDFEKMEGDLLLYKFLAHSMEWKMSSASSDVYAARKPLRTRFSDYLRAATDGGVFRGSYLEAAQCLGCSYRQLMRVVSEMYRTGELAKQKGAILFFPKEK